MFGFAVYRKDFGQVRFVKCSSNSFIEFSVFAILFSTVLWSVYFRFRPRFAKLDFGGLPLGSLLVGGRFSPCNLGGLCECRVCLRTIFFISVKHVFVVHIWTVVWRFRWRDDIICV